MKLPIRFSRPIRVGPSMIDVRPDLGAIADLHVLADDRVRADAHVRAERRLRVDDCGRVNHPRAERQALRSAHIIFASAAIRSPTRASVENFQMPLRCRSIRAWSVS